MRTLLMLVITANCVSVLNAADPYWQPLVDDQTLLVAAAPIDAAAWAPVLEEVNAYGPTPAGAVRAAMVSLHELGAKQAALVLGVTDIQSLSGPIVAIRLDADADSQAVTAQIEQLIAAIEASQGKSGVVQTISIDNLLLIGTRDAIRRYQTNYSHRLPDPRTDFVAAIAQSESEAAQAVAILSPGADTRRVIRELSPELPAPWDDLNGPLIADGLRHTAVRLALGDPVVLEVELVGADESSAKQLETIAGRAIAAGVDALSTQNPNLATRAFALSKSLEPQRTANRVTISLNRHNPRIDQLLSETLPAVAADMSEKALANHRLQTMKQLALAMHNFHDTHRHFPTAAAIRDSQGKPLLSWRVAILPWIEQQNLYEQFNLAEPWDSPHNLPLVKEMPAIFADPSRRDLAIAGLTTYQVPVGSALLFAPAAETEWYERRGVVLGRGFRFRDVTDGTSRTIMISEVAAEHAVTWTKPADWEVDLADPLAKLRQDSRKTFVTAWADGSARVIPVMIDPAEFAKALTRGGRELLDDRAW